MASFSLAASTVPRRSARFTPLKWLDVGTFASALNLSLCNGTDDDDVRKYVGDPATNDVAKGIILLKRWWIERLSANPDAQQKKCSVYSAQDRAQIWEAFSADQLFDEDGASSMDDLRARLRNYRDHSQSLILASSCLGSVDRQTGSPSASCRVRFRLGDFQAPFQRRADPRPPEHTDKISLPNMPSRPRKGHSRRGCRG